MSAHAPRAPFTTAEIIRHRRPRTKLEYAAVTLRAPLLQRAMHGLRPWAAGLGLGRRALSRFRLANFDDVEFHVHYLPGPRNQIADWLSRPPMLGELEPAVEGLVIMVRAGLALLPGKSSTYRNVYVHCDDHTRRIADEIRDWRHK